MSYTIELFWDQEARVWVATSKDVPGLVLESESFDTLLERALLAAPELLELNGQRAPYYDFTFASERQERILAHG